jgi:RNA polymerase sigma-70 factor (ECF subfamily)
MSTRDTDIFEEHRAYLSAIAYRMLGSVADAEDVMQDAFLRWRRVAPEAVEHPRAFLSKTVSRLCLDKLKEARRRREIYVGPWLPEPVINDPALSVSPPENVAEDISFALMLALERLSPLERAAFLLHDVFDMEFAEIAVVLERNEAACRQLASRARAHVRKERPRFDMAPDKSAEITEAFFTAAKSGDASALRDLLAKDATLYADGGGRVIASLNPIYGGDAIARFYEGVIRKAASMKPDLAVWSRRAVINGLPGEIMRAPDGVLMTTALEIRDGKVVGVYVLRNPEKLRHLAEFSSSTH